MKALAIKYRPQAFEDVTEQGSTVTILRNQLETNSIKHCYLFCGPAGCGKTTLARIFAKEANKGIGNIIELDAASNNGVDDVRRIIDQAQTKPLEGQYKCFIIDECVTGDTEILTNTGWKRIDNLQKTDKVAQYTNSGNIEFVDQWEYVHKQYTGTMYEVSLRNGKRKVLMSPHHVQPTRKAKSKKIVEEYIEDCKFGQGRELIVSGKGTGNNKPLSSLDRLYIACQADGYCSKTKKKTFWEVHLSISSKINRLTDLLDDCAIDYTVYGGENSKSIRFYYEFPRTKKLKDYFDLDMGVNRAQDFISEILLWDGSVKSGYPGYYSCTDKDNVDFVSSVLTLCGYSGTVNVTPDNNPNHNDVWSVNWYYQDYRTGQAISKKCVENWKGDIYCVKVPSHMIVLRVDGFAFVSGNCHSLSKQGWQAFLKLIEEPPATAIFIFCTTDAQTIPKTIISRVQRYQFQKISTQGIIDRLAYILDKENIPQGKAQEWLPAIEYIARVAAGGMRDALTMLDKCLAFNEELTVQNVMEALSIADYTTFINLTDALVNKVDTNIIHILEDAYNSGFDLKQFIKQYIEFMLDVCKYNTVHDISYTQLPDTDDIKTFLDNVDKDSCLDILDLLLSIDRDIKYSPNPRVYIEALLLTGGRN